MQRILTEYKLRKLVLQGLTTRQIAERLGVSIKHVQNKRHEWNLTNKAIKEEIEAAALQPASYHPELLRGTRVQISDKVNNVSLSATVAGKDADGDIVLTDFKEEGPLFIDVGINDASITDYPELPKKLRDITADKITSSKITPVLSKYSTKGYIHYFENPQEVTYKLIKSLQLVPGDWVFVHPNKGADGEKWILEVIDKKKKERPSYDFEKENSSSRMAIVWNQNEE